jgi:hypothetical protein
LARIEICREIPFNQPEKRPEWGRGGEANSSFQPASTLPLFFAVPFEKTGEISMAHRFRSPERIGIVIAGIALAVLYWVGLDLTLYWLGGAFAAWAVLSLWSLARLAVSAWRERDDRNDPFDASRKTVEMIKKASDNLYVVKGTLDARWERAARVGFAGGLLVGAGLVGGAALFVAPEAVLFGVSSKGFGGVVMLISSGYLWEAAGVLKKLAHRLERW